MPDSAQDKALIDLTLQGRHSLEYDFSCGTSIDDAIEVLKRIESSGHEQYYGFNKEVSIAAFWFFCFHTVYMAANLFCYYKRPHRDQNCCCKKCCFVANKIINASISLGSAVGVLVLTGICMDRLYPKYHYMYRWSELSKCIGSDEYLMITTS